MPMAAGPAKFWQFLNEGLARSPRPRDAPRGTYLDSRTWSPLVHRLATYGLRPRSSHRYAEKKCLKGSRTVSRQKQLGHLRKFPGLPARLFVNYPYHVKPRVRPFLRTQFRALQDQIDNLENLFVFPGDQHHSRPGKCILHEFFLISFLVLQIDSQPQ